MRRKMLVLSFLLLAALFGGLSAKPKRLPAKPKVAAAFTNISIYGAWHCGSEFCSWASVRNMTDFDTKNHWLIDRGDGTPSVNLIVLSFVQPLKLLNNTNDSSTTLGRQTTLPPLSAYQTE
jgi:hypothetical protein